MRVLILGLTSNVCYLAVILIFFVVTWWLLLVTARYRSLRLVPIFSMNDYHQILRKICHVVTKAEYEVIILYEFEKL